MSEFIEPWEALSDSSQKTNLERELRRETSRGHQHCNVEVSALACRVDRGDALFRLKDGALVAVVHLTHQRERSAEWPITELFQSIREFQNFRMKLDHDEYKL